MTRPDTPRETPDWPARIVALVAVYAVAGGLVTFAGWLADVPRLTDWRNDGISMFPNTAACAVLCGIALLLSRFAGGRARPLARATALVAAALGGLTLCEHLFDVSLGIDAMLISRTWGQAAAAAPMRMGPPASTSFLLLGTALYLATTGARGSGVSAGLGVAVMAIAALSLTGYLYGAEQMFTIPRLTGIAFQTASMLFALAVGVVASVPDRDPLRTVLEPTAAGMLARRAWPLLLAIAVALGWMRVFIQERGLVDTAFGTALRTLVEMLVFSGGLWWAARMVGRHERALRAAETEVRHQARQLAAFVDTAAIALHRSGPDGTILWANDAELALLGYAPDEYIGHHIAEFHVDQAAIADILARLHRGEKLYEYAARMRCKDGSIKSVLIDSSVLWEDGRFVHTQCFTRDVTERVRAEAERAEANRRKDEFLAILAHELRNPLAPIRNAARHLAIKTEGDPELARPVGMIERQVGQMSRLIDDLLDVSRITRGTLELRRERVACADVVEAAIEACREDLAAKGHRLRTDLPPRALEIEADRDRLVQVLCNLLGNAAKYTPPGGHIDLAVGAGDERTLVISVKDDGVGIPSGKLGEIFDLFARVEQALDRQGGLGVGLTLARQLVELHGGTIEPRSPGIGRGSEFVVRLPVIAPAVRPAATVVDLHAAASPLRIVVADDNEDAAESLAALLEMTGHDVHVAFDGEAAVTAIRKIRPDVALLDIGMPKLNGYEVARRIRGDGDARRTYLVAITGWGQDSDRQRAEDAGFDAHLVKPVPPDVVQRLLATIGRTSTPGRVADAPA